MTLVIPNEFEAVLKKAVASGAFASEADALRHALGLLAREQAASDLPELPAAIDREGLLRPGVGAFDASDRMPTGLWPEDESTDDFLSFLKQSRQDQASAEPAG